MPLMVPTVVVRLGLERRADNATATSTSATSVQPSWTTEPTGGGGSNNAFSNNQLFYILVAVLGAFAVVSLINLIRMRRRRRMIMREAERLDLMIPGMLGYVPMRERPAFVKSDGWRTPDWWDVRPDTEGEAPRDTGSGSDGANGSGGGKREEKNGDDRSCAVTEPAPPYSPTGRSSTLPPVTEDEAPVASSDLDSFGARGRVEVPDLDDLRPLALIPQPELVHEPAKPWSNIPYFPNYVSYPRSDHTPKPSRWASNEPNAFDGLIGEPVHVIVALRMPTLEQPRPGVNPGDDDGVIREWSGLELGVLDMTVQR